MTTATYSNNRGLLTTTLLKLGVAYLGDKVNRPKEKEYLRINNVDDFLKYIPQMRGEWVVTIAIVDDETGLVECDNLHTYTGEEIENLLSDGKVCYLSANSGHREILCQIYG